MRTTNTNAATDVYKKRKKEGESRGDADSGKWKRAKNQGNAKKKGSLIK